MSKIVLVFGFVWTLFTLWYFREEIFRKRTSGASADTTAAGSAPPDLSACMGNGGTVVPSREKREQTNQTQPATISTQPPPADEDDPTEDLIEVEDDFGDFDIFISPPGEEEDKARALEQEQWVDAAEAALADESLTDDEVQAAIDKTRDLEIFDELYRSSQERSRRLLAETADIKGEELPDAKEAEAFASEEAAPAPELDAINSFLNI